MEMIEVDGLRITYERAGSGPPLVLLHGYVGDGPTTWRPQLDGLGDDFTLIAWNAPGAGGSSDPPESFGMAGYADALAGFIAALGLGAPQVAGLSFGGALALALYRRHPEIPRTLVLASAYAGWGGSLPPEAADQRLRQALVLADLAPDEFVGTLLPTMFSPGTDPVAVEAFGAAVRAFHPTGFRAMARASAEDLRDVLPHRRPLPAALRRRGRPRPAERGQGPRGLDPALEPGRAPGHGPRRQHRGPRGVQPRRPGVPQAGGSAGVSDRHWARHAGASHPSMT
jgi:pimeloyl-ACP methyl ester carboxylesterase